MDNSYILCINRNPNEAFEQARNTFNTGTHDASAVYYYALAAYYAGRLQENIPVLGEAVRRGNVWHAASVVMEGYGEPDTGNNLLPGLNVSEKSSALLKIKNSIISMRKVEPPSWDYGTATVEEDMEAFKITLGYYFYYRNSSGFRRIKNGDIFWKLPAIEQEYWNALELYLKGMVTEALARMKYILERSPLPKARMFMAVTLLQEGRYNEASPYITGQDFKSELLKKYRDICVGDGNTNEDAIREMAKTYPRANYLLGNCHLGKQLEAMRQQRDDVAFRENHMAAFAFGSCLGSGESAAPSDCPVMVEILKSPGRSSSGGDICATANYAIHLASDRKKPWIVWKFILHRLNYGKILDKADAVEDMLLLLLDRECNKGTDFARIVMRLAARTAIQEHFPDIHKRLNELMKKVCEKYKDAGLQTIYRAYCAYTDKDHSFFRGIAVNKIESFGGACSINDNSIEPPGGALGSAGSRSGSLTGAVLDMADMAGSERSNQLLPKLYDNFTRSPEELSKLIDYDSAALYLLFGYSRSTEKVGQITDILCRFRPASENSKPAIRRILCEAISGQTGQALSNMGILVHDMKNPDQVAVRTCYELYCHLAAASYLDSGPEKVGAIIREAISLGKDTEKLFRLCHKLDGEYLFSRLLAYLFNDSDNSPVMYGRYVYITDMIAADAKLSESLRTGKRIMENWGRFLISKSSDVRFMHCLSLLFREKAIKLQSCGKTDPETWTLGTLFPLLLICTDEFWDYFSEGRLTGEPEQKQKLGPETCRQLFLNVVSDILSFHISCGHSAFMAGNRKEAFDHFNIVDLCCLGYEAMKNELSKTPVKIMLKINKDMIAKVSHRAESLLGEFCSKLISEARIILEDSDKIAMLPNGIDKNYEEAIKKLLCFNELDIPLKKILVQILAWGYDLCFKLCLAGKKEEMQPVLKMIEPSVRRLSAISVKDMDHTPENQALSNVYKIMGFASKDSPEEMEYYKESLLWNPNNKDAADLSTNAALTRQLNEVIKHAEAGNFPYADRCMEDTRKWTAEILKKLPACAESLNQQIDATQSVIYFYRGNYFAVDGMFDAASECFRQARALNPEDRNLLDAIEKSEYWR